MATSHEWTAPSFRSLALMLRGRAGLTQRELASAIGVSDRTVQVWEAGHGHPRAPRLQRLIALYMQVGAFRTGRERYEAAALWGAALESGRRFTSAFDAEWFAPLLATAQASRGAAAAARGSAGQRDDSSTSRLLVKRQHVGDVPVVSVFYGRTQEYASVVRWVQTDGCRLVGVVGMGGIGKTALTAKVAQAIGPSFEAVFWRSLRNAPPCREWLGAAVLFLSEHQVVPAEADEARRAQLLELLRDRRCLLVLDNFETVLEPCASEVRYRDGYTGYGLVLELLGETAHQSSILVTSREGPAELRRLQSPTGQVRLLRLDGLDAAAAQALLASRGLAGDRSAWRALVDRYRGNALALQVVGEVIATVFSHDIDAFLAAGEAVFGDIRRLLETQFSRLSPTERTVLYWLAVEREPVDFSTLAANVGSATPRHNLLEALDALERRCLLESSARAATFTLQPVVLEHATEELISVSCAEIKSREPRILLTHALIKAESLEYVRHTQERLIAAPVLARLADAPPETGSEAQLLELLEHFRGRPRAAQGYGPGNVVNLLRLARGHLRDLDLSGLSLRQVDFAAVSAQGTSLARAELANAIFAEQFGAAMCASLSADGSFLVVGTISGEVRVWRLSDRTPVMLVQQPTGAAWDVAISSDGVYAVSCGGDCAVVWGPSNGREPIVIRTPGGEAWRVAMSADGHLVAVGAGDGTTTLWDARNGQSMGVLQCHTGGVRGLALSANGDLLASSGADGTVRIWDTQKGACLKQFARVAGDAADARAVALSPDGRIVAAGDGGAVYVRDVFSGNLLATLLGHTGPVWGVSLSSNGRLLASCGADRTVRLWDTRTGEVQSVLHDHAGAVVQTSISADGRLAASVARDGAVRVWEVRSGHCLVLTRGSVPAVFEVALSADGCSAVSGAGDGHVRVWDTTTGRCRRVLKGHVAAVWAVALTPNARLVASGGIDGTVRLWRTSGETLAVFGEHTAGVLSVALSADGKLIASGGLDGTMRLWDTRTNECLRTQKCGAVGVRTVRLSTDGRTVLTAEFDGTVRLWDTSNGACRGSLTLDGGEAGRLAFSADGRLVACADPEGRVRLWDTRTLECVRVIQGQRRGVRAVGLSTDGSLLVAGGVDGSVGLWSAGDGRSRGLLRGHTGEVWAVAFSADGRLAVSSGLDGTLRLWDTTGSGMELRTMRPDRPYERMDITGASGVTDAQRRALLALGAVDLAT
jgi:WD40 repeat protein/DNA-binding XRE family transcriptional regulator